MVLFGTLCYLASYSGMKSLIKATFFSSLHIVMVQEKHAITACLTYVETCMCSFLWNYRYVCLPCDLLSKIYKYM